MYDTSLSTTAAPTYSYALYRTSAKPIASADLTIKLSHRDDTFYNFADPFDWDKPRGHGRWTNGVLFRNVPHLVERVRSFPLQTNTKYTITQLGRYDTDWCDNTASDPVIIDDSTVLLPLHFNPHSTRTPEPVKKHIAALVHVIAALCAPTVTLHYVPTSASEWMLAGSWSGADSIHSEIVSPRYDGYTWEFPAFTYLADPLPNLLTLNFVGLSVHKLDPACSFHEVERLFHIAHAARCEGHSF